MIILISELPLSFQLVDIEVLTQLLSLTSICKAYTLETVVDNDLS